LGSQIIRLARSVLGRSAVLGLAGALALASAGCGEERTAAAPENAAATLAFSGALGWAATTPGGRGGEIVRVTTLAGKGPGSLREAIEKEGPRIIVFEVGGVIDLEKKTLVIRNPFVTIAGQTAPSPGITLIKGGIDIRGHDVIVQHIRIRPGDAGDAPASGWGEDGISTVAAYNVIVDHCSLTWATDENLSASGPRFTGKSPDEWREGTSHRITFSNNIIAEGLSHSTHPKFEHSKGSLIHDNVSDILIYGNLYAHNYERSPLFKGGVRGAIVNNFIYNPGPRAIHYNLQPLEWGEAAFENGRMTIVGNVLRAGPSTPKDVAFIMIGGGGDLELYERDNVYIDEFGKPLERLGRYTSAAAAIVEAAVPLDMPEDLAPIAATAVEAFVLANAGARPWDRDAHDVRLLADVAEGRGRIIDSQEEVGGYPKMPETARAFEPSKWSLETMEPNAPDVLDASQKSGGT
jgi:pectate lyase